MYFEGGGSIILKKKMEMLDNMWSNIRPRISPNQTLHLIPDNNFLIALQHSNASYENQIWALNKLDIFLSSIGVKRKLIILPSVFHEFFLNRNLDPQEYIQISKHDLTVMKTKIVELIEKYGEVVFLDMKSASQTSGRINSYVKDKEKLKSRYLAVMNGDLGNRSIVRSRMIIIPDYFEDDDLIKSNFKYFDRKYLKFVLSRLLADRVVARDVAEGRLASKFLNPKRDRNFTKLISVRKGLLKGGADIDILSMIEGNTRFFNSHNSIASASFDGTFNIASEERSLVVVATPYMKPNDIENNKRYISQMISENNRVISEDAFQVKLNGDSIRYRDSIKDE